MFRIFNPRCYPLERAAYWLVRYIVPLIFVVTLLLHPETSETFGLDNVDGTLNPELVRQLTSVMVKACTSSHAGENLSVYQAFITSHHPSSLDSFDIFDSEQRIFIAQRDEGATARGSTRFQPFLPSPNMTKEKWVERVDGRKLSSFLLEEKIPGALG